MDLLRIPSPDSSIDGSSLAVTSTHASTSTYGPAGPTVDLVGGPWSIIESDPGVFTTVMQKLGVRRCEAAEVYSVDPDGLSHLGHIHGFIFCSRVQRYSDLTMHTTQDVSDDDHEDNSNRVWFASQLIANACATQAILNVLLNCPDVNLGDTLYRFQDFTSNMSPVMRGLALSNDPSLREIHNSMARPADMRDSLAYLANHTALTEAEKKKASQPKKKKKTTARASKFKEPDDEEDSYHFVGYVPFGGKVWELDGLRAGPLEVGDVSQSEDWLDVVRPAIRMKMESLQDQDEDNIRFNLLAIVDGGWEKAANEFELLRREKNALERLLDKDTPEWRLELDDPSLIDQMAELWDSSQYAPTDAAFGYTVNQRNLQLLQLPPEMRVPEWIRCLQDAQLIKTMISDEEQKAERWTIENIKRTHDYEPFFRELAIALYDEGYLIPILGLDEEKEKKRGPGRPRKNPQT